MHTTTHILAWLPSEYMGLGDLTPALPLFYPNLIHLQQLPPFGHFITYLLHITRHQCETVTDGRNTSNIYKGTVSKPNTFSWTSYLTLLLTNKFILVMFQVISELKTLFFCLTLGQTVTGVLSDPWALCLSHRFFVILYVYITCQILFFIQNWMQDYLQSWSLNNSIKCFSVCIFLSKKIRQI